MKRPICREIVLPAALVLFMFEAGCSAKPTKDHVRNGYASRADCEKDFAKDQCDEDKTRTHVGGSSVGYWGPWYMYNSHAMSSNAAGVVNTGGHFMPSSAARAATPSAMANFSHQGAGSVGRVSTTSSFSRGGFGSTASSSSVSS